MEINWSDFLSYANKVVLSSAANLREEEFSFYFPVTNQSSTDESSMAETAVCCNVDDFFIFIFILFAFVIC